MYGCICWGERENRTTIICQLNSIDLKSVFYSGSHLEIQTIMRLIYLWSTKTPAGKAQDELQVCKAGIHVW